MKVVENLRLIQGLIVPSAAIVLGVLAKKVARKQHWNRAQFYLGAELTLAAFVVSLLSLVDKLRVEHVDPVTLREYQNSVLLNVGFVVFAVIILFLVVSLHQEWESNTQKHPKTSFFWLVCVCNMLGFSLLMAIAML